MSVFVLPLLFPQSCTSVYPSWYIGRISVYEPLISLLVVLYILYLGAFLSIMAIAYSAVHMWGSSARCTTTLYFFILVLDHFPSAQYSASGCRCLDETFGLLPGYLNRFWMVTCMLNCMCWLIFRLKTYLTLSLCLAFFLKVACVPDHKLFETVLNMCHHFIT